MTTSTTTAPATAPARAPVAFDYSAEDPADAAKLRRYAPMLRNAYKQHVLAMIRVGETLILAKAAIKHGSFTDWIAGEVGFTLRTAENYMNAARHFREEERLEIISSLQPTTVYELAAPSTPKPVRESILNRLKAGDNPGDKAIVAEIKTARAAAKPAAAKPASAKTPAAKAPPAASRAPAKAGASALVVPPDDEIAAEGFIHKLHAMAGVEFGTMMDLLDRAGGVSPAIRKAHSKLTAAVAPVTPVAPPLAAVAALVAAPASDKTPSVDEIEDALSDDGDDADANPAQAADEASDEPKLIKGSAPFETVETETVVKEKTALEIRRESDAIARKSQLEAMLKGRRAAFPRIKGSKPAPAESATTDVDDDAIDPEHVAALYGVEPEDAEVLMATMEEAPPAAEAEMRDIDNEDDGKQKNHEIEERELQHHRAAA